MKGNSKIHLHSSFLFTAINHFDWEDPGITQNLIFLLCTSIVLFSILLALESGILQSGIYFILRLCRRKFSPEISNEDVDDDVLQEKHRLNTMSTSEITAHNLLVRQLSKFYGNFLAVNQISVAVKE